MNAFSVNFPPPLQLTFVLSLFLSTGALIDFLVLGFDSRATFEEPDSNLRMYVWLPLYLLFTYYCVRYINVIFKFMASNKSWAYLLTLCVASSMWSGLLNLSIYSSLQLVLISSFAVVVGSCFSLTFILRQVYFVLSTIVVLSFGVVLVFPDIGVSTYAGEEAFRGVFIEKNRLGQVLVYYLCLSFAFFKRDIKGYLVLFMAVFLLLGNGSATALVLCLLLPVAYLFSRVFFGSQKILIMNSLSVFSLLILSFIIIYFSFEYILIALGKDPTLTGRTELWEYGLNSIFDKPILGYGYNSFWKYEGGMGGEYIRSMLVWGPMSMHNGWFETILQLGLVGLLLTVMVYIQFYRLIITALNRSNLDKQIRCIFLLAIVIFIWSLMQHIILRHQAFTHYLFVILFCSLGTYNERKLNQE